MSTTDDLPPRPREYKPGTGTDRYARFAEDWLAVERTQIFDLIAASLEEHKYTLAVGGNGLGKSFAASALGVSALYTNPNTVVPITAGNGDTLKNSIWKPIKGLWQSSQLPGSYKDNDRSLQTGFSPEWFLECHSPKYPEDLEGDHNDNVVYIIEEAEKPGVTAQHIDSARSTMGDDDHMLVLANPPEDETNVVYELQQRDSWHVLRFPTWESRNARVDRGLTDKDRVGGLSGVPKMRDDWREYHDEPWPGIDEVIRISSPYLLADGTPTVREREADRENPDFRKDLHKKWYKRRAGVMPPDGSQTWRPFTIADVKAAYNRTCDAPEEATTAGFDVARSTDQSVLSGKHGTEIRTHYADSGANHVEQKEAVRDKLYTIGAPPVAVDAVGEGSGVADELAQEFNVTRFSNGAKPRQTGDYYDCWAEALALFGEFLDDGVIASEQLYKEALAAARTVQFSTRALTSRGGDVIEATKKDRIKERLGHSPDYLDSALMCNWLDMAQSTHSVTYRNGNAPRSGGITR